MEDLSPFLTWYREGRTYRRTLLLVDELPNFFEDNEISLKTLNEAEVELDQIKPSFRPEIFWEKQTLLYCWTRSIRWPFFKLLNGLKKRHGRYGLLSEEERDAAGFSKEALKELQEKVVRYTKGTKAETLVRILLAARQVFFGMGQTATFFYPACVAWTVNRNPPPLFSVAQRRYRRN